MTGAIASRFVAIFIAIVACAANAQTPAPAARDVALAKLASRLDLPLVDEAVATFSKRLRRTLPGLFVDSIGQGAALGPRWKRGNRYFDTALQRVDRGLAAEEARSGPLLVFDRRELFTVLRAPWNEADIAFLTDTADTALGREAQRAIDARATLQVTRSLVRRIGNQPGLEASAKETAASFADLEARAEAQAGDASLMLLALRGSDPARANRLQRLLGQVDTSNSDALGQRLADRLSQRLLEAAAVELPDVIALVVGFQNDARP